MSSAQAAEKGRHRQIRKRLDPSDHEGVHPRLLSGVGLGVLGVIMVSGPRFGDWGTMVANNTKSWQVLQLAAAVLVEKERQRERERERVI